jgi:hypothetical protein
VISFADMRSWVVDVDLEPFFDHVHHDTLMVLVAKRIADPRLRTLIHRYLQAGIMVSGGRGGSARWDAARRPPVAVLGEHAARRGGPTVRATRAPLRALRR